MQHKDEVNVSMLHINLLSDGFFIEPVANQYSSGNKLFCYHGLWQ
jgi:hypothetical protein